MRERERGKCKDVRKREKEQGGKGVREQGSKGSREQGSKGVKV